MSIDLAISNEDILTQLKISQMLPAIEESIIVTRIIQAEAERAGIEPAVSELQQAADDFRKKNNLTSAKKTELWLQMHRLSLDEFEQIVRLQLVNDKLKEVILADRVEKYFYQHQLDFDRVALSEVVLQDKELATELYYAVREGEIKFQDVASKYLEDVELQRKGGYLGRIRRKDLNSELLSVFSVTNPPQVIKPITTAKGYHLLWIDELVKAELDPELFKEIQSQIFVEFLKNKLRENRAALPQSIGANK
jgi:parvulin-like peptidyl-prolyl isomerase